MELWYILVTVAAVMWVLFVLGFALYFWLRVMPSVRELKKTVEGQLMLSKLIFPPRFPRKK